MRLRYYGKISQSEIIRDVRAKIFDIESGDNDSDLRLKTIQLQPNPTSLNILADSDFGFTRTDYGADSDAS